MLTAGVALSGTYTNTAEIITYTTSVTDGNGNPLPDVDSAPDGTDGNGSPGQDGESTDLIDDELTEDGKDGGDEDDHDPATIVVVPPVQFGDRVWIEDDSDGLASTGEHHCRGRYRHHCHAFYTRRYRCLYYHHGCWRLLLLYGTSRHLHGHLLEPCPPLTVR